MSLIVIYIAALLIYTNFVPGGFDHIGKFPSSFIYFLTYLILYRDKLYGAGRRAYLFMAFYLHFEISQGRKASIFKRRELKFPCLKPCPFPAVLKLNSLRMY